MYFHTAMITSAGGRAVNQDYADFRIHNLGGMWVLADGLGGYHGGEIAAKLAVETLINGFKKSEPLFSIQEGLDRVQQSIQLEQSRSSARRSMRTTVVVLTALENQAYWAHVGDSRLYLFRDCQLISQTKDHSVCQALVTAGEIEASDIRFHEDRNRLFRVLGSEGTVKATYRNDGFTMYASDAFLLCSDGFWEYVTEEEMEDTKLMASSPSEWLGLMESLLKERVKEGHDNYTALAVFVKE